MLYVLENIHINPTENLFFHQVQDGLFMPGEVQAFFGPIRKKHLDKGSFVSTQTSVLTDRSVKQLATGEWQLTNTFKFFVSIDAASEYFNDLVTVGSEYRRVRKEWHQDHGILNETNILDEAGNIVAVLNSCQAHKCIHFGSCPQDGSGCSLVPTTTLPGIYPIYHLNKV